MSKIERDEHTGTDTTGHEWDGIRELNTPLPKWWIYTFYACIAFALGYTVLYPAWPNPFTGRATPGLWHYSSREVLAGSLAEAGAAQKATVDLIAAAKPGDILKDEKLRAFATAAGAAAFKVNCVQCHGSGAAGAVGYPNLNDNDWLWGGTIDQIHQTIQHGVNYDGDKDSRVSQMTVFGPDPANNGQAQLKPDQITDVANYVWTLSGGKPDDAAAATRGKDVFAQNCVACHGDTGTGNKDMGAPNLADQIWLYSKNGSIADVAAQVTKPHHGVMPAWAAKLDATKIKELAVYVYGLGGGEKASQ